MTAAEQIAAWAAAPNDEIFVGIGFGDGPQAVKRMSAHEALRFWDTRVSRANSVVRVGEALDVSCVLVEGEVSGPGGSRYRIVLAPVKPFV